MAAMSSKGFAELLQPEIEKVFRQLYGNATMTNLSMGFVNKPDDMQSLYDLLDEKRDVR